MNALDPEKYSVSIISLSLFDPERSIFKVVPLKPGIDVFYFNFEHDDDYSITGYFRFLLRKKESFKHFQSINALISRINPSLVHFHTSPRELILHRFFDLKVPGLFTDHLLRIGKNDLGFLKTRLLAFAFRQLYKGFHVIAVSEEIKKTLYKRRIVTKNTDTIPNGVNVDFFQRGNMPLQHKGLNVVYVSRIEEIKGHDDLIKAWAQLKELEPKTLYIAGPDGLNGKMQKLAQDLDCSESIVFAGAISDPRALLQTMNLAVFPSHKEGLPLSLLEKMAMELPVIASDIPELSAIIVHEKNGLLFKENDAADLAAKIRYLYNNPEYASQLGKQARASVVENYNFTQSQKRLEAIYTKILN